MSLNEDRFVSSNASMTNDASTAPPSDIVDIESYRPTRPKQMELRKEQSAITVLRTQPRSLLIALFAALGGLLFGLDIGYMAQVLEMTSLREMVTGDPQKELSSAEESWITAIMSVGCVIASLPIFSGPMLDRVGRKWTIVIGGVIFAIGSIMQGAANSIGVFYAGRFILGLSIGWLACVVPVYQGELAPKETRGALMALYQFAITLGILIANLVDWMVFDDSNGFRLAVWYQVGVALTLSLGMLFFPESPRLLMAQGKYEEAKTVLRMIRKGAPEGAWEQEFEFVKKDVEFEKSLGESKWRDMVHGYMLRLLLVGMAAQILQQLTGINAFMYYGPKIFKLAGMDGATFQVIQASVNVLATIPAILIIDKVGRTTLLKWGAIGMSIFLLILGIVGQSLILEPSSCFQEDGNPKGTVYFTAPVDGLKYKEIDAMNCAHTPHNGAGVVDSSVSGVIVTTALLFVACFAISWGPVVWAYCAEIFPQQYRSKGVGVTTTTNWVGNYIVAFVTPLLMEAVHFWTYIMYGGFCLLCVAFTFWIVETAGIPLEDITARFEKKFDAKFHKDVPKTIKMNQISVL